MSRNTTNAYDNIVTGTIVEYNGKIYTVGECYEDCCVLYRPDERGVKVFKDDCEPQ